MSSPERAAEETPTPSPASSPSVIEVSLGSDSDEDSIQLEVSPTPSRSDSSESDLGGAYTPDGQRYGEAFGRFTREELENDPEPIPRDLRSNSESSGRTSADTESSAESSTDSEEARRKQTYLRPGDPLPADYMDRAHELWPSPMAMRLHIDALSSSEDEPSNERDLNCAAETATDRPKLVLRPKGAMAQQPSAGQQAMEEQKTTSTSANRPKLILRPKAPSAASTTKNLPGKRTAARPDPKSIAGPGKQTGGAPIRGADEPSSAGAVSEASRRDNGPELSLPIPKRSSLMMVRKKIVPPALTMPSSSSIITPRPVMQPPRVTPQAPVKDNEAKLQKTSRPVTRSTISHSAVEGSNASGAPAFLQNRVFGIPVLCGPR